MRYNHNENFYGSRYQNARRRDSHRHNHHSRPRFTNESDIYEDEFVNENRHRQYNHSNDDHRNHSDRRRGDNNFLFDRGRHKVKSDWNQPWQEDYRFNDFNYDRRNDRNRWEEESRHANGYHRNGRNYEQHHRGNEHYQNRNNRDSGEYRESRRTYNDDNYSSGRFYNGLNDNGYGDFNRGYREFSSDRRSLIKRRPRW